MSLVSALAACSSSNKPTAEEYDDTAQAIGGAVVTGGGGGDVASMADSVSISLGAMPLGLAVMATGQVGGNRLGIDYTYTATCKDAAGAVLAKCDRTTDRAQIDVAWSGNLDTSNLDAAVSRDGSLTITGLQSDTATISGDSSFSFDTTLQSIFHQGVTSSFAFDASATYNAIVVSTQDRQVVGGSAAFSVTAHRKVTGTTGHDVDKAFEVDATIAFNADHSASVVLDGTEHFTLNVTTGSVKRAD
jgi:hypothetical protein